MAGGGVAGRRERGMRPGMLPAAPALAAQKRSLSTVESVLLAAETNIYETFPYNFVI